MSRAPRARSFRATQNDEIIRQAAVGEVLRVGLDNLSLRDVGHAAGLTHGATYARYEDVGELLVDLWNAKLRRRMDQLWSFTTAYVEHPTPHGLDALFTRLHTIDPEDVAAFELMLGARRVDVLSEEMEPWLAATFRADACGNADAHHTRAVTLFGTMMTLIISGHRYGVDENFLHRFAEVLQPAMALDPRTLDVLPVTRRPALSTPTPSSDLREQLAYATFEVVGRSGFTKATIARIARRAQCSPGAIYKFYPSKEDLLIGSFGYGLDQNWIEVSSFHDFFQPGFFAQRLYDIAGAHNSVRRNFAVEVSIAAGHSRAIHEAVNRRVFDLRYLEPVMSALPPEDQRCVRFLFSLQFHVTAGVAFLASCCSSLECINFGQFTEALRTTLRAEYEPAWAALNEARRTLPAEDVPAR